MILAKKRGSSGYVYYALCEEVKRTAKRVYVCFAAGERYTLEGGEEKYVTLDNVLSEQGTPEMLEALQRAFNEYNQERDRVLREANATCKQLRIAHDLLVAEITKGAA